MSAVIKDASQQNDKPLVSLRNLNKHYGDFAAVDNISLDIKDGEFLTFLGSSGSGKSTTLSMLAGFETPSSGEILVNGQSLVNVPPHKRDIGMLAAFKVFGIAQMEPSEPGLRLGVLHGLMSNH